MPNRPIPKPALWLALVLASLLTAPLARSGPAAEPPRDAHARFAPPTPPPTIQLGAATPVDNATHVTDLPAEEEEQDRVDARDEPRAPFLIPSSFLKVRDPRLTRHRSAPSLYPLRC